MSFAEVKESITRMTAEERLDLEAFLVHLSRRDAPDYQAELTRRMDVLADGGGIDLDTLVRRHGELSAAGR